MDCRGSLGGRPVDEGPAVSVVIATRNRVASLRRLLRALARQECLPDEVVIVDASDRPLDEHGLRADCGAVPTVVYRHVHPGVCAQRNLGIRTARGRYVLLCDDDVEPPPEYLARLVAYLEAHPSEGAASGLICEADGRAGFRTAFGAPSFRHLAFAFLFQLSVWADVEAARAGALGALPLRALRRWYRWRGNRWTAAGWPLVTQVRTPVIRTATYGLGAALVRRGWLLASPFDEKLGPHGVGDNYGVALGFPEGSGIAVLGDLRIAHHRAPENRLPPADAAYQRALALDYFIRTSGRFSRWNTAWLAWSLVGKAAVAAFRRDRHLFRRTLAALHIVVTGRNPLLGPAGRSVRGPFGRDRET
ncbi:MAG TPA: glycosyltransferase [Candidatus Tectomicrobia bacterium]|nr:glycosyltransferase [Candidatus Tectomicrobia bacterium]